MSSTLHPRIVLYLALALALLLPWFPSSPAEVLAAGEKVDRALAKESASDPGRRLPIIVEMVPPREATPRRPSERRAGEARALLDSLGPDGKRVGDLPLIGGAAGFANARGIAELSRNPNVAFIHRDIILRPRVALSDDEPTTDLAASYPFTTRANRVWLEGTVGKGVGVAVFDSGIASHEDLTLPANRLVAAMNFADDRRERGDAGGHGTHVAGIIAGNGTRVDLSRREVHIGSSEEEKQANYVGMAPGAHLIDVRVLNAQGNGRISSVVAGIQWVLKNRDLYNIRVINLSIGAPISESYRRDPLSAAVELAWKRGIVVVAPAGNGGPAGGSVETPGIDPYVITVGATDDQGTATVEDDVLAPFSSWGTPLDSTAKPELVAPGRRIVSLRARTSTLDQQLPDRVVRGRGGLSYFRLSGTSMSTAMVSGAVALMLERRPGLTPDQVKAVLTATSRPLGRRSSPPLSGAAPYGKGLVDAYAATTSPVPEPANRGLRPADGFARALYPVLQGQPLVWKDPNLARANSKSLSWDNLAWDNLAWDNLAWDNLAWDNLAWDNLAWDNLAWDNLAWDNLAWESQGRDGAKLD